MKFNRNALSKMMSEISQELGVDAPKKRKMRNTLLWTAGSIAGYYLMRKIYNRVK
ncbi:MAG: hypothetical protein ACOX22_07810 [Caldicoprobacterales bacterium]|nr:hypothetical protein [Clostridiales bacterium]